MNVFRKQTNTDTNRRFEHGRLELGNPFETTNLTSKLPRGGVALTCGLDEIGCESIQLRVGIHDGRRTLEFLTIDPLVVFSTEALNASDGAGILGRATLNRERFGIVLDGLEAMVASGNPKHAARCFNPGYALREPAPGDAIILICLECCRVEYARDGIEGWSSLRKSVAPELDSYLSGLVKELGLRTYMDPAP